jgi:predicted metal-dependent phosphoesterase TrpH
MLKIFKADLHIHTCLSPCADLKMSPTTIAMKARESSIDILGICDHNSAENVPAVIEAAAEYEIRVLPGIEVTSLEEIHILALFDNVSSALHLQELIYKNLPGENDEEAFGMQVVVNKNDEVLHFNKKLLIGASTFTIDKVIHLIHDFNGIAIAAHIDRESFSLLGQLGFLPDNLELDALEISRRMSFEKAASQYDFPLPIIQSSDAHFPDDIGKGYTQFYMKEGTAKEIKMAFLNRKGRKILH